MAIPSIDLFFTEMVNHKASDLYLTYGSVPSLRIGDTLLPVGHEPLNDADIHQLYTEITTPTQREEFESTFELNTALPWKDAARFRINLFYQQGHIGIVIRRIQLEIPSLHELNLPPVYGDLSLQLRGLILVVGPTGAGKTTSLAAMVGHRNTHGHGHIITVEDPIEFIHLHNTCIITQRDVGLDTYSYAIALKNALRQRPDLVVVGEIRDREVMEQAMYFAETGHLCIATLHANNSSQAIERVLNFFPEERHRQVLFNLSINLKAVLSQRLLRNVKGTRTLACEVLLNTGLIRTLIEENKVRQIREMIEKGTSEGMQTFDQHIYALIKQGLISEEVALAEADNPSNLRLRLSQKKGLARGVAHSLMLKQTIRTTTEAEPGTSDF